MAWTIKDKSETLLITERHVSRLTAMGVLPKSNDPKEITAAYVRHLKTARGDKGDLIAERIRLTRILADKRELELKIAQGELIHVDTAMALWGRVIQGMRSKLLAFPSKLAPLVIGCSGLPEIKETAEKLTHEVLEELANPDLKKYSKVLRTNSIDLPHSKAAHKAKRKPVGRSKAGAKPGK